MTLKSHTLTPEPKRYVVKELEQMIASLEALSETELASLRHEIDLRLHLDLGKLDLSEELALQFRQAKALLHEVSGDKDTPINQKSQLFNAARAQLTDIVRQQESVWSMERLKIFEVAFVKASKLLTEEAKAAFFDLYGRFLKGEHVASDD